jgi:hypothetical protein
MTEANRRFSQILESRLMIRKVTGKCALLYLRVSENMTSRDFKVFTAVLMRIQVCWDVALCRWVRAS